MVGVLPVLASVVVDEVLIERAETGRQGVRHDARARRFDMSDARPNRVWCAATRGIDNCCSAWSAIDRVIRLFERLFDEDEFLSPYGMRACRRPTGTSPTTLDDRRAARQHRLRTGRVDDQHVRRQLQLARPDLVPAELPAGQLDQIATAASSATTFTIEYPTGSGSDAHARRDRRGPPQPADLDLPRRRRRPSAVLRRGRAVPGRSPVAGLRACSTSTSTATTAPGSAHRTRPAGPVSSPT